MPETKDWTHREMFVAGSSDRVVLLGGFPLILFR